MPYPGLHTLFFVLPASPHSVGTFFEKSFVKASVICSKRWQNILLLVLTLSPPSCWVALPRQPWFYISVDIVTGLPVSVGNTVILSVIDNFSKTAHFIPLPKLLFTKETVAVLLFRVFQLHDLPLYIVSDQGPQFMSLFWKGFCLLIGATVSLLCSYHPSPMDRQGYIQEMETGLHCQASQSPTTWSKQLLVIVCP